MCSTTTAATAANTSATMISNVTFNTVMDVSRSWDKMKQVIGHDLYREKLGQQVYIKLFELEPKAKMLLKYQSHEDVMSNPSFAQHASLLIDMFEVAIGFLGPDLDPLVCELVELGERHERYNIPASYLHFMGDALLATLVESLDGSNQLSEGEYQSWKDILHFFTFYMSQGYDSN